MNEVVFPFSIEFAGDTATVLDITPFGGRERGVVMMASGHCQCEGSTVQTNEGLRMQFKTQVGEAAMALFDWKEPIVAFAFETPAFTFLVGEEYRLS